MDIGTAVAIYTSCASLTAGVGLASQGGLPDPTLAKDLGVIPYLLLLVVSGGVLMMGWLIKRMADAQFTTQTNMDAALKEMVKTASTQSAQLERQSALLECMSDFDERILQTANAQLEIARQMQNDGARRDRSPSPH